MRGPDLAPPKAFVAGSLVQAAGEVEAQASERQAREGLRLPADTWTDLAAIAGETGTEDLLQAWRPDSASPRRGFSV